MISILFQTYPHALIFSCITEKHGAHISLSSSEDMHNPLGNLVLGLSAAFLRFFNIFLLINPCFFIILPIVLADTWIFSLVSKALVLYFDQDQAGYCFLNWITLINISPWIAGFLRFFGFLEYSLKPIIPDCLNLLNYSHKAILHVPKCLAVRDVFCPWPLCQSNSLILNLAHSVNWSARNDERAMDAAPGRIVPYIVIWQPLYLPFVFFKTSSVSYHMGQYMGLTNLKQGGIINKVKDVLLK